MKNRCLLDRFRLPSSASDSRRSNSENTTKSLASQPSRCALSIQACCCKNHLLPKENKIVGNSKTLRERYIRKRRFSFAMYFLKRRRMYLQPPIVTSVSEKLRDTLMWLRVAVRYTIVVVSRCGSCDCDLTRRADLLIMATKGNNNKKKNII